MATLTSLNRVQALTREDILDAALALFGKNGVDGTRMIDIADEAEIGKGTLYLHFDTKDALFDDSVSDDRDLLLLDIDRMDRAQVDDGSQSSGKAWADEGKEDRERENGFAHEPETNTAWRSCCKRNGHI